MDLVWFMERVYGKGLGDGFPSFLYGFKEMEGTII
jgi:hypothetical protein